jgi:ArsR family metal-binding transcriptional regulator|tara:strand:- start:224 stop:532 length:309 start_codon:yes stop_codon:yes gene_type:complete
MASIIKTSINLNAIPKDRIFVGKKGKYLPITITLNDEPDQFGNQGPVVVEQTKEEREAKEPKTYLGNVKVVWTNGDNVAAAPRGDAPQSQSKVNVEKEDLPF